MQVYSYAVVMWEIGTRSEPYKSMGALQVATAVLKGERLPIPKDMPVAYRRIMEKNWDANPENRDDFKTILSQIEDLLEAERAGKGGSSMKSMGGNISARIASLNGNSQNGGGGRGGGGDSGGKSSTCSLL